MPKKSKNSTNRVNFDNFRNWLESGEIETKDLQDLLVAFQKRYSAFMEEKNIEFNLDSFERILAQLLDRYFPTLDEEEEIKLRLWKGSTYESFGEWEKALDSYKCVLTLTTSQTTASFACEAFRWIGLIYIMQSKWTKAKRALTSSLKLAVKINDDSNRAYAYNGFGYLCFEKGELDEADRYWQLALELADRLEETSFVAQVHNNLGALANVRGQWQQAVANYAESLPRLEKVGDSRGLAEVYHNLGMTYSDQCCWAEAGENFEKSSELAAALGDSRLQAMIKLNRVKLHLALDDIDTPRALCQQALQTFQFLHDSLGEADVLKFLGIIRAQHQQWSLAQDCFRKSIKLSKRLKSPICEAEARLEYGRMLQRKGSNVSARKQLKQSLEIFERIKASNDVKVVRREMKQLNS